MSLFVVATTFIALLEAAAAETTTNGARPNILFIVGDDVGYADLGFHGCKENLTPNLDALAASGVRFTSGYVSGPYCSPTRAALLTGRYQNRFGHEFNPGRGYGMPIDQKTIADRLRTAGYRTALIGKWHLGSAEAMRPLQRGFDEFFGFLGGAHGYFNAEGFLRGNEPVKEMDYSTDAFGREAEAFIDRNKARPWFLYLAFNAVHTPMDATEARLAKFSGVPDPKRRAHNAMLFAMDEAIGKVLQKLRDTGQERNTLVAFISDNGAPTMPSTSINAGRNEPFRGSKRTTLEGGIRVPFIVSWPGRVKAGVFNEPAIQFDLTVTALAAAGVKIPSQLEGVDLLPFLSGATSGPPHEALYWRFGEQMAIRAGDWKLVRYDLNADTGTGQRKQGVTGAKLYNLASDAGETNDVGTANSDKIKELQAKWDAWNKNNLKPLWGFSVPGDESDTAAPQRRGNRSQ